MRRRFFRKALSVLLVAILAISLTGCSDDYDDEYGEYDYDGYENYEDGQYDEYGDYEDYEDSQNRTLPEGDVEYVNGLSMSADNSTGELSITRKNVETAARSDDGIWTIFVYLCGTDLESQSGMGTADIEEMKAAASSDNVRFVVETGGTDGWDISDVDDQMIQRFVIQNGEITKVDETTLASMGKAETLSDFLVWGTKEYNSEHMGLVMWNHGGGSISGVCFDEKYDSDSITLMEMDSALLKCVESSGRRFDFIGFDACLMGTVEVANVMATYADFIYGSEEMEPGSGWDYTAIGNYLAENNDAHAASLGKQVCDGFFASCEESGDDALATFSVIDLSKIDELLISFNKFAKNMYEAGEDSAAIAEMIRGIESADNFGGIRGLHQYG